MTQWTAERRAKQAQRIREWQPWTRSTGPKTSEGKQRSRRNAFQPRLHTPEVESIRRYLAASQLLLKTLARKRKEREEAQRTARRMAKQKVLHICGDAPLSHLYHPSCCPAPVAGSGGAKTGISVMAAPPDPGMRRGDKTVEWAIPPITQNQTPETRIASCS